MTYQITFDSFTAEEYIRTLRYVRFSLKNVNQYPVFWYVRKPFRVGVSFAYDSKSLRLHEYAYAPEDRKTPAVLTMVDGVVVLQGLPDDADEKIWRRAVGVLRTKAQHELYMAFWTKLLTDDSVSDVVEAGEFTMHYDKGQTMPIFNVKHHAYGRSDILTLNALTLQEVVTEGEDPSEPALVLAARKLVTLMIDDFSVKIVDKE